MMYAKNDYEIVRSCPWCSSNFNEKWGSEKDGFLSVKCKKCGLIYVKNRLNAKGRKKYYSNYLEKEHQADETINQQRKVMYELEFKFINTYLKNNSDVLDIGCSGGYFLDYFSSYGHRSYGVEFGKQAAKIASKKYHVWYGEFPDLDIRKKFDLIVFRGVIEHVSYPKMYLDKAINLLRQNGFIYITSTPNSEAFSCDFFKEMWNMHRPEEHIIHFGSNHFDDYFKSKGFNKIIQHHFYENTPYANIEQDIIKVSNAISLIKMGGKINFISPPFWGNMMSLIYQKP